MKFSSVCPQFRLRLLPHALFVWIFKSISNIRNISENSLFVNLSGSYRWHLQSWKKKMNKKFKLTNSCLGTGDLRISSMQTNGRLMSKQPRNSNSANKSWVICWSFCVRCRSTSQIQTSTMECVNLRLFHWCECALRVFLFPFYYIRDPTTSIYRIVLKIFWVNVWR